VENITHIHFCLPRDQTGLGVQHRGISRLLAIGPGLAVTGDRKHDQPRIDLDQVIPADAEFGHDAGAEIFGDDIGCGRQFQDQFAGAGGFQVYADIALADILLKIIAAEPVTLTAEPAGHIALGWFNLEDLGTQIGQHPRGIGPGDNARKVEDLQSR
jgi:hypothetical protein